MLIEYFGCWLLLLVGVSFICLMIECLDACACLCCYLIVYIIQMIGYCCAQVMFVGCSSNYCKLLNEYRMHVTLLSVVLFPCLVPFVLRAELCTHPPNLPGQGVAENKVGSQGVMPRGQGSVGGASAATLGAGGLGGGGSQGEPPNAWGPGAGQGPWFYFVNFTKLVQFCLYLCHTFSYFGVNNFTCIVIFKLMHYICTIYM